MAGLQSAAQGDIQSPQAPTGQDYGTAGDQLDAQSIVPVAGNPLPAPGKVGAPASAPPPVGSPPGSGMSLADPSMYPEEPITTGLSSGPGAGPEVLNLMNMEAPELAELRQAYQNAPSEPIRRLIEWSEMNT